MTSPIADASVYSNLSGLAALKRDARAQDPDAVREVARQFESIFAKMVLSSMRQATFGDSLFGSDQQQFYQGMFDDQLAMELTKGRGLGLAEMLVQQLTRAGLIAGSPQSPDGSAQEPLTPGAQGNTRLPGSTAQRPLKFSAPGSLQSRGGVERGPWKPGVRGGADAVSGAGNAGANAFSASIQSREDFIAQLWPCAEAAGRELGIDPRNLLAQAALETGWGKSLPCDASGSPSFNFFGIKASGNWQGDSVSVRTLEFEGGLPVPKHAKFRAYPSAEDSFRDYVEVLRNNPRYASALNTGNDAQAFAKGLQQGGYATDPRYAEKIVSIAQNISAWTPDLKSGDAAPIPLSDSRGSRP
jgi:flagellar protein FlgJ